MDNEEDGQRGGLTAKRILEFRVETEENRGQRMAPDKDRKLL